MARPEKVAISRRDPQQARRRPAPRCSTEYRGLKVGELADAAGVLRAADAEYKVFKNTLARRAAEEAGMPELVGMLEGPTAITFVQGDAVGGGQGAAGLRQDQPARWSSRAGSWARGSCSRTTSIALADISPGRCCWPGWPGGMQAPLVKAAGLFQALHPEHGLRHQGTHRPAGGRRRGTPGHRRRARRRPPSEAPAAEVEAEAPAAEVEAPAAEVEAEAPALRRLPPPRSRPRRRLRRLRRRLLRLRLPPPRSRPRRRLRRLRRLLLRLRLPPPRSRRRRRLRRSRRLLLRLRLRPLRLRRRRPLRKPLRSRPRPKSLKTPPRLPPSRAPRPRRRPRPSRPRRPPTLINPSNRRPASHGDHDHPRAPGRLQEHDRPGAQRVPEGVRGGVRRHRCRPVAVAAPRPVAGPPRRLRSRRRTSSTSSSPPPATRRSRSSRRSGP